MYFTVDSISARGGDDLLVGNLNPGIVINPPTAFTDPGANGDFAVGLNFHFVPYVVTDFA